MRERMRELKWTEAEKKLSRRAFDAALQAELAEVLQDFKARAAAAQTPGDMWPVEHFLNQRRRELDAKYDYRYSQLISVFGRLIREGRLTEGQLRGLSQDKLEFVRRIATL
jgi:Photoprotection regulator fluorescence recovery protein